MSMVGIDPVCGQFFAIDDLNMIVIILIIIKCL
jgi:hypothetical protein